jgi:hypothetical protein
MTVCESWDDILIIGVVMNNKGSVLILLVVVIALVIVLGLSVLNSAVNYYAIKKFNTDSKESFYMAETGLNEAYVMTCDLINESIEESLQMADDYLLVNPHSQAEAENIFVVNYMIHIRANIGDRIKTGENPFIEIRNEDLIFVDDILSVMLKASYMHENNVSKVTGAEFVISVPGYNEVSSGTYDVRNYIKLQNWNS